jgi:hypothetical protein
MELDFRAPTPSIISPMPVTVRRWTHGKKMEQQSAGPRRGRPGALAEDYGPLRGRRKCCANTGGVSEIDLGEVGELAFYDLERHALHRCGGVAGQALPL